MSDEKTSMSYRAPAPVEHPKKRLVAEDGSHRSFEFFDRIEVGRGRGSATRPGFLLVDDPTVSSRHCVVVQDRKGRCFVRDTSRNGTRLDGRRLSPNSKTRVRLGQVLTIGRGLKLSLEGASDADVASGEITSVETLGVADATLVTNLVGDIRGFTTILQRAKPQVLQTSIARVFARLEQEVITLGGTVKEFQGDALFAFWERSSAPNHAVEACRAALALHRLSVELGRDPSIWAVEGFPLEMDFALTTGLVSISGYGGDNVLGLSMVGESVVLAFRLEKIADDDTGPIIACPDTRLMAARELEFRDLGPKMARGFDEPQRVFALVGEL